METSMNPNLSGPEAEKSMGFFEKIAGVFMSPGKTARALCEKPAILFPFLVTAFTELLFILSRYSLYNDFLKEMLEMQLANQGQTLSAEEMQMAVKFTGMWALIGTPVSSLVMWIVSAAILFGLVKLMKGAGTFKQTLSIIGYAYIIMVLYAIIRFAMSFVTGSVHMDASPALVIPGMKGTPVYGFLRGLDFFAIWQYAVILVGISVMSKLTRGKMAVIGTILYASLVVMAFLGRTTAMMM